MALDSIQDLADEIDVMRQALQDKITERDALLQDAKQSGIPYSTLGRRSRLSKKRLEAIMAKPRPEDRSAL